MWKSEFFFEYINERIIFFRDNVYYGITFSFLFSFICVREVMQKEGNEKKLTEYKKYPTEDPREKKNAKVKNTSQR